MKFSCPTCSAKYQIADEKVAGRTVKMKCRKCGTTIPIRAPTRNSIAAAPIVSADSLMPSKPGDHMSPPPPSSLRFAPPPPTEIEWHAGINGQSIGPMSRRELERRVREGSVNKETFVWHEGMDGWKQIPEVAELDGLLSPKPSPFIAPPPPSMPARAKAQALNPVPRMSVPGMQAVVPAPRPAPAPGHAAGLPRSSSLAQGGTLTPSRPTPAVGMAAVTALRAPTPAEAAPAMQAQAAVQAAPKPQGWDDVLGTVGSVRPGAAGAMEAPPPPDFSVAGPAPAPRVGKERSEDSIMMRIGHKRANPLVIPFAILAALVLGVTVGFVLFGDQKTKIVRQVVEVPGKVKEAIEEKEAAKELAVTEAQAEAAPGSVAAANPSGRRPQTQGKTTGDAPTEVKGLEGLAGLDGLSGPSGGPAGPSSSSGGGQELSSSQIQSTVAQYQTSVKRGCWEKALMTRDKNAPSSARVSVAISVAPSGSVTSATTSGDPVGYSGLASCISSRVRGWQFPRSSGATTVNVPFVFAAQ